MHAFARVLGANHVARDGVGYDAGICESEIFGDDGAPAVSAKSNRAYISAVLVYADWRGHVQEVYARPEVEAPLAATQCERALEQIFLRCSSSHLTILPTSWERSRGQISRASGVSTTTRSWTPMAATNFRRTPDKISCGVEQRSPGRRATLSPGDRRGLFVDGGPGADVAPADVGGNDEDARRACFAGGGFENGVVDGNIFEAGIDGAQFVFDSFWCRWCAARDSSAALVLGKYFCRPSRNVETRQKNIPAFQW